MNADLSEGTGDEVTVITRVNEMGMLQVAKNYAPDVVILEPKALAEEMKDWEAETPKRYQVEQGERENMSGIKIDNRHYVCAIAFCECIEMRDDHYILRCRIKERGEKLYKCSNASSEFIQSFRGEKTFWLSESAACIVRDTITEFNRGVENAQNRPFSKVTIPECGITLYYCHQSSDLFDFLLEVNDPWTSPGTKKSRFYVRKVSLSTMMKELAGQIPLGINTEDVLPHKSIEALEDNPVFRSATDRGDEMMRSLLRFYYHLDTKEDVLELSRQVFGTSILPSLSKEYDQLFAVDAETISFDLLRNSGYSFLHVPYFAMKGKTHKRWGLNPHTKCAVDASHSEGESISFCEYLRHFEMY